MLHWEAFVTSRLGLPWCALTPTSALLISPRTWIRSKSFLQDCRLLESSKVVCLVHLYIPKAWSTVGLQSCTVAGCAEVYPAPIPGLLIHKSKTHCLPSRSCWYVGRRKNMETMRSRGKCDPRWVKGSGAWAGGCALSSLSCLQNGRHDFPSLDLGS